MPQLIVTPTIDSTIDLVSPDTNFGAGSTIAIGVQIAGGQKGASRRAIANFDVSALPSGAVIAQATIQRSITTVDPRPHSVRISRCTRPSTWTENGVTWNQYDVSHPWTNGGGDYSDTTPSPIIFAEALSTGPFSVSGLGDFVRDAVDLRSNIVSLILRNENEVPLVSERSSWLATPFWQLVIDYNVTSEPARRGAPLDARSRKPTAPRRPPGGQRPSKPSSARERKQP